MFRSYVEKHPQYLCQYISARFFAYNTSIHRTTGPTPIEIIPSLPPPVITLAPPSQGQKVPGREKKEDCIRTRGMAIAKSGASLHRTQARYKGNFDIIHHPIRQLSVQDFVFHELPGAQKWSKLAFDCAGLFEVLWRVGRCSDQGLGHAGPKKLGRYRITAQKSNVQAVIGC